MAQNPKAAAKPEDPAAPKKSNKKMIFIAGGAVLLVIGAATGFFLMKGKGDDHHAPEVKVAPPKNPIFINLEPITVNLRSEGTDQYLQLGLGLKVYEPEVEAKIKLNLPEIRSRILQLLTTKTARELLTAEGKSKLVKEIQTMGNGVIGIQPPAPVMVMVQPAASAPAGHDAAAQASMPASAVPMMVQAAAPAEPKGIIDVLFSSFIIQ